MILVYTSRDTTGHGHLNEVVAASRADNPFRLHSLQPYPRSCRTILCRQATIA